MESSCGDTRWSRLVLLLLEIVGRSVTMTSGISIADRAVNDRTHRASE
jgi:hypothetical protein